MMAKNILKKTIPIMAFLSQSCSPSPEPVNKLKEYNLKNRFLYKNFREIMEKRIYFSSKDKMSEVWFNREEDYISLKKKYDWDENLIINFKDYGMDGLSANDEFIDGMGTIRILKKLNPDEQLSTAKIYTHEIEKLIQEDQNKD